MIDEESNSFLCKWCNSLLYYPSSFSSDTDRLPHEHVTGQIHECHQRPNSSYPKHNCSYCNAEIIFKSTAKSKNGKFIPLNLSDGSNHFCKESSYYKVKMQRKLEKQKLLERGYLVVGKSSRHIYSKSLIPNINTTNVIPRKLADVFGGTNPLEVGPREGNISIPTKEEYDESIKDYINQVKEYEQFIRKKRQREDLDNATKELREARRIWELDETILQRQHDKIRRQQKS